MRTTLEGGGIGKARAQALVVNNSSMGLKACAGV